jgi:hypothetical protein
MYSKSSTFLALTSILAILAVLSIAINDMQGDSVRRPFPTSGKDSASVDGQVSLPNGWDSLTGQSPSTSPAASTGGAAATSNSDDKIIQDALKLTPVDQTNLNSNVLPAKLNFNEAGGLPAVAVPANNSAQTINSTQPVITQPSNSDNVTTGGPVSPVSTGVPVANLNPPPAASTDLLVKNVNDESLRMAGYSDFIIQPKPFAGKLFGIFDISMLGSLNIIEKDVIENRNGNEVNVLTVYEFELGNKDTTQEIYDYLKAKIKNELGITINESNQFGLSSFYINFGMPNDNAFLVVKTRSNVYALSYPKAKYGNKDYFVLTSVLLRELI